MEFQLPEMYTQKDFERPKLGNGEGENRYRLLFFELELTIYGLCFAPLESQTLGQKYIQIEMLAQPYFRDLAKNTCRDVCVSVRLQS